MALFYVATDIASPNSNARPQPFPNAFLSVLMPEVELLAKF
jgi:hypothetical protein